MPLSSPIGAGELSERITIEQASTSQDAVGQAVNSWSTVATVWAGVNPLSGREFFAAGATQSQETIVFRIRYMAGLTSAMRVSWQGNAYPMTAPPVNVDGASHTLELYCTGGRPS